MRSRTAAYPDISDILARKAQGRRRLAALGFAEKLAMLDALRERVAPLVRAREKRQASQRLLSSPPSKGARAER